MTKIKVLTVSIDVTSLSKEEVDDLMLALEVQCEDLKGDHKILSNSVKNVDLETGEI